MSDTPPPSSANPDFTPERTHCEHCLTGQGTHFERWDWTLLVNGTEAAVQLARDGWAKLTIPLTADQVDVLMDGPVTLSGVLEEGL